MAKPLISLIYLFIYCYIFLSLANTGFALETQKESDTIWPEFKLPPFLDKERNEILAADKTRIRDLQKKGYTNMETGALALVDINGDGNPDRALLVTKISKNAEGGYSAHIVNFKKEKGTWSTSTGIITTGDVYFVKDNKKDIFVLVENGCGITINALHFADAHYGPFQNNYRNGRWINIRKAPKNNKEVFKTINKVFKPEIISEKQDFRKNIGKEYTGPFSPTGLIEDINSDGNFDIIVSMNNENERSKREPNIIFCDDTEGCANYLLLCKEGNKFEKISLGRSHCIGESKPDDKGIKQIYTEKTTAVWNGSTYMVLPYRPNWLIGE